MKEIFLFYVKTYIDVIIVAIVLPLTYGILKYFKIQFNYIFVALIVVVALALIKMLLKRNLGEKSL